MIFFWSAFPNATTKTDREWDTNINSLVTGPYGIGKGAIPSSELTKTLSANYTDAYFSFHYTTGSSLGNTVIHTWQDGAANPQIDMRNDTSGSMFFTRNGTTIGTASGPGVLLPNTVYHFCGRVKISATVGIAELKIGGVFVLNSGVTNLNTKNATNAYFNYVRCIGSNGGSFANYILFDSTASSGNDLTGYPSGEPIIDLQPALSVGNHAQWTPSASTNVSNIDDALQAADDDTTYNSSLTPGQIDDFTMGNVGSSTGTIIAIGVVTIDRIDDATPRTVSHHIESASATWDGTAYSVAATYKTQKTLMFLDPNTSAVPTIAARNSMKVGYKEIS